MSVINQIPTENVEGEALYEVENQYWRDMHDALSDLKKDPKFQKVILEGYFKDKAINGVSLLATDYIKQNNLRSDVMEQLVAISNLEDYFATIENLGSIPAEEEE